MYLKFNLNFDPKLYLEFYLKFDLKFELKIDLKPELMIENSALKVSWIGQSPRLSP